METSTRTAIATLELVRDMRIIAKEVVESAKPLDRRVVARTQSVLRAIENLEELLLLSQFGNP